MRASVTLKGADADKLSKQGRLKVGLIFARVRIKVHALKCFKCLRYGHTRHTCEGPDRSNICSLCQAIDHRGTDCTKAPKCIACTDIRAPTNHYPDSGRCSAYQKALRVKKSVDEAKRRVDKEVEPTYQNELQSPVLNE